MSVLRKASSSSGSRLERSLRQEQAQSWLKYARGRSDPDRSPSPHVRASADRECPACLLLPVNTSTSARHLQPVLMNVHPLETPTMLPSRLLARHTCLPLALSPCMPSLAALGVHSHTNEHILEGIGASFLDSAHRVILVTDAWDANTIPGPGAPAALRMPRKCASVNPLQQNEGEPLA